MATNPYFSNYNGEQDLVEGVTIEVIQAMGIDCIYIPREYLSIDRIFGEDPGSYFEKAYTVEMYMQNYKGFEGTDVITQFGLEIKDRVYLVLARKRFKQEVTDKNQSLSRPREGDLIYFPPSKSLFEINFVEHENPFYPLGRLYSYFITAELFTYSYEKINTTDQTINDVYIETRPSNFATTYMLSDGSGSFTAGNQVKLYNADTSTDLATAIVDSWNPNVIVLSGITGTFNIQENTNYYLLNSNNTGISYYGINPYFEPYNNGLGTTAGNNYNLESEALGYTFDSNNPFSEYDN